MTPSVSPTTQGVNHQFTSEHGEHVGGRGPPRSGSVLRWRKRFRCPDVLRSEPCRRSSARSVVVLSVRPVRTRCGGHRVVHISASSSTTPTRRSRARCLPAYDARCAAKGCACDTPSHSENAVRDDAGDAPAQRAWPGLGDGQAVAHYARVFELGRARRRPGRGMETQYMRQPAHAGPRLGRVGDEQSCAPGRVLYLHGAA